MVVLTNGSPGGDEVIREARETAFRGYLSLEDPEPEPVQVDADELAEYAGTYGGAMFEAELRIEDGTLVEYMTSKGGFPKKDSPPQPAPPPTPLTFYDRDRVFVAEGVFKGARCEFMRDENGRVAWYRDSGRVLRRIT